MLKWTGTYLTIACVGLLIVGIGCRGNDDDLSPEFDGPPVVDRELTSTLDDDGEDFRALPEDLEIEELLFDPDRGLQMVFFDFDSYDLRPQAVATLSENAAKIRETPGVIIQIEGHCDERGTQEYNLALGEKRALAVREHLIKLGVAGDRLVTISYGEEDPLDPRSTEEAWSRNRRCEFNRAM